VRLDWR